MQNQRNILEREIRRRLAAINGIKNWRYPPTRMRGLKKARKLTWDDVDKIRFSYQRYSKDNNKNALAKRFGVSATTIDNILRGKKWKTRKGDGHVPHPLSEVSELAQKRAFERYRASSYAMKMRCEALGVFDADELDEMFPECRERYF